MDGIRNLFDSTSNDSSTNTIAAISVTILILVITTSLLRKNSNKIEIRNEADETKQGTEKKQSASDSTNSANKKKLKSSNSELRNVFDVKQRPALDPSFSTKTTTNKSEKPFKSSYYYAHNKDKSKGGSGGYKDGLKMEDYVMNGPKLLSRNGVEVNDDENVPTGYYPSSNEEKQQHQEEERTENIEEPAQADENHLDKKKNEEKKTITLSSKPINRYLWDDDGNSDGIAKLYIDSLPDGTSSSIKWADAGGIARSDVMVKLVPGPTVNKKETQGLILQIRRTDLKGNEVRYHLNIPQMHGEAKEVKAIVKAKKLIVKIIKKKMAAWPQLPSKMMNGSSNGGNGAGVDFVDEDLFKSL